MIDLTRIELENFRPFFGKHNIDIDSSDKKLVIFSGNNGSGKTSLTEAIQWCLFGSFSGPEFGDRRKKDFDLFNKEALIESKSSDLVPLRITLTFEKEEREIIEKIVFSRSMQVRRKKILESKKGPIVPVLEDFEFIEEFRGKYENFSALKWEGSTQIPMSTDSREFRDTYFPDLVRDYYIIYGEHFVDPSNSDRIKLAVERNCFASTFDKIKQNLENVKIAIIKTNTSEKKRKERLDTAIGTRNECLRLIKEKEEEIINKRKDLNTVVDALSEIDRSIGKSGGRQTELLKEERDEKEYEIKRLDKEIREKEKTLQGDSFRLLIKLWSNDAQKNLLKELNKRVKRGEIPPNIKTEFINSLLDEGKCICKRPLSPQERKVLEELKNENVLGENYQSFLDLKHLVSDDIDLLTEEITSYSGQLENVGELKDKKLSNEQRLRKISEELDSLKNVAKLESDRKRYVHHRDTLGAEIALIEKHIEEIKKDRDVAKKEIDKIGEVINSEGSDKINRFIDDLINLLSKTKEEIIESTRENIESFTSKVYIELFKNAAEVDRVDVDKDYRVRVILKKNNKEYVKTNFSSGESLIFAISFLTALRRYSGYNGPIFLDSPFSLLDEEHRVAVSVNLPKSIPGQLIIFTRPDTFGDVKLKIKPYINKIYTVIKEREWHSKISEEDLYGKK